MTLKTLKKSYVLILLIFSALFIFTEQCIAQATNKETCVDFRYGSEVLYKSFRNNKTTLANIKTIVEKNQTALKEHRGYIKLISTIPSAEQGNVVAINFASIRGAIVRKWIENNYPWLSDKDFSFYITFNGDQNCVEANYVESSVGTSMQNDIFYSLDKKNTENIQTAMKRYTQIPFLNQSTATPLTRTDCNILDPALDPDLLNKKNEKTTITIYYRFNNKNLDKKYLSNAHLLGQLDSIMKLKSANYIDSLRIVAYSSPEGSASYNQKLSEHRADALKKYIVTTYPQISQDAITTEAYGANWKGLLQMAQDDPNLPMKGQVLKIINNPSIKDTERQKQIEKLDGGRLYRKYILPNYYRYLRGGVSLFQLYNSAKSNDLEYEAIAVHITEPAPPAIIQPEVETITEVEIPETIYEYPLALRTNLLYDIVGGFNIGVEVPFANHWSWIADIAYANWHTSSERYALKTLEYGTEVRYWFGATERQKARSKNWKQPLKGWNIGAYFRYWDKYDVQWKDGYQGDDVWSAGLTMGYSLPLSRPLALEFSLGAGYLSTKEHRHYHQPEIDKNNDRYLMWQETGKWSGFTLTKARISLIWLIQYKKK